MKSQTIPDIHQILNALDEKLGIHRVHTKVANIEGHHINLISPYKITPGKTENLYCTLRISKDINQVTCQQNLTLNFSPNSLLTNRYRCHNENFREKIEQIMQDYMGNEFLKKYEETEIKLSGKLLSISRRMAVEQMRRFAIDLYMNRFTSWGKIKPQKTKVSIHPKLNDLQILIQNANLIHDTIEYLFIGPYGSGNPEWDEQYNNKTYCMSTKNFNEYNKERNKFYENNENVDAIHSTPVKESSKMAECAPGHQPHE